MDNSKITKELYDLCIQKREGKTKLSWDQINFLNGKPFSNGENLRSWIKKKLKKEGKLPNKEKYINTEAQKKLDDVKKIIGEQTVLKHQIRQEKSQLTKIQKNFVKSISIAEEIEEYLKENCIINIPEYCYTPIEIKSNYEMVVHISDWHIGLVINNCEGNYYNWEIANKRIDMLINECYKYINLYNIKKIYVINTGDMIEHTYMREQQSQFCEFPQSEQINRAIELIYRLLCALCKDSNVEYDSIFGNHDRMSGDKTANLDGDNAEVIIRRQIKNYCELSKNKRLTVIDRKPNDNEIIKNINNIDCKFIHGEDSTVDGKKAMKNEISMDNRFYNILFKGHLHNFNIESENHGRYIIYSGCLSGYNSYSKKFKCTTVASQTICIFDKGKIELIKDIQLNK